MPCQPPQVTAVSRRSGRHRCQATPKICLCCLDEVAAQSLGLQTCGNDVRFAMHQITRDDPSVAMFCGIAPCQHNAPLAPRAVFAFAENDELLAHPHGFGIVLGLIGEVETALGHAEPCRQPDRHRVVRFIGGVGLRRVVDQVECAVDDAMQIDVIEIPRDIDTPLPLRCRLNRGSEVRDELLVVPCSAAMYTNRVLHGCGQQRSMEAVQSVAIAQPRQGVGDACGVQTSRASLGILGMQVRVCDYDPPHPARGAR